MVVIYLRVSPNFSPQSSPQSSPRSSPESTVQVLHLPSIECSLAQAHAHVLSHVQILRRSIAMEIKIGVVLILRELERADVLCVYLVE